jgi:NTP pyrophosphatase (non-canonical NTP hydrolase)
MVSRYRKLEALVEDWADSIGIFSKGNPTAQALKTIEEANEILDAIDKESKEEVVDGLGDTLVTLIIQAKMQKVDLLDCLQSAYDVISKRSGVMKDGQFIKDKASN